MRRHRRAKKCQWRDRSQVPIREKAPVAVALQPVIQESLIEVGCNDFLPQFVSLCTDKRQLQSGEHSDQRLRDAIRIGAAIWIGTLDLAERRCDHQQAVGKSA